MLHTQNIAIPVDTHETHQSVGLGSVLRRWKAGFKSNSASRTRRQSPNTSGQQAQPSRPNSLKSSQRSPSQAPSLSPKPELPLPDSQSTVDRLVFRSTTQTIIHSPLDKRNRGSVSSSTCILRRSHLGPVRDTTAQVYSAQKPKTWSGAVMLEPGSRSESRVSDRASTSTRNSKGRFSIKTGSLGFMRHDRETAEGIGDWKRWG